MCASIWCSKEAKAKLFEEDKDEDDQASLEFEEYTVNGSQDEGEDDEESKDHIGMRRMRIRRRGK